MFKKTELKPKRNLVGHWPSQTVSLQQSEI